MRARRRSPPSRGLHCRRHPHLQGAQHCQAARPCRPLAGAFRSRLLSRRPSPRRLPKPRRRPLLASGCFRPPPAPRPARGKSHRARPGTVELSTRRMLPEAF
ncbi:hypothetical protein FIV42_21615 [Persicimonas caeni]|uniref:Uncharacterized protein n=1 Tax=Persicimonas caeni TaxID=2292766 RepID=A0A4Y6Q458_PERCE|nr:hypothetical protein FIV42_21615 [Persicimonas caeni]QED36158.1 hypothetical protein FRD00_21610 [Persicimonas caeni]